MDDDELLGRMEQGIADLWASPAVRGGDGDDEAFTIVRLPSHVHALNKTLYEPRVVSVGPYHLGSDSTRGMQGHKWRFLRDFLLRDSPAGAGDRLDACVLEARAMEERARRCYGEPLEMGSDEFVQMLVLDGCFVLEFLLKWSESDAAAELDAYMQWTWIYVYYDLLLVENQIPFFVVAKLFSLAMGKDLGGGGGAAGMGDDAVDQRLLDLIYNFFSLHEPLCQVPAPSQLTVHHLLHLQYQRMVIAPERKGTLRRRPTSSRLTSRLSASLYNIRTGISASVRARMIGSTTTTPLAIPCVTELQEFGVAFREKASPVSQFDVMFRGGTMEIPRLALNAGARILLANLLALEQTTRDWKEGIVTSYLVLMNALVNTAADVAVLQRRGVLDNMLSNEDAAAAFFNRLGGCALFDPRGHHYARLFADANEYCNHRWNRYIAVLKRDHLRTPCSIISLLAAATLLCISVMSAGFLICRYRHACS
ncbi:UPF0481 protein At3g47200-like [Oryza brachyantha]|uniref:Uncharacterized protein n=1 Tax=Oryza brachyantha TaxID=4533 RepID=J3MZM4_ORYBR|nr:UPF0481 protein At3g47200-like [Oryza brachyantha]